MNIDKDCNRALQDNILVSNFGPRYMETVRSQVAVWDTVIAQLGLEEVRKVAWRELESRQVQLTSL